MKFCIYDTALCFKSSGAKLIGFCATYVDDTLHFGNPAYCQMSKLTEQKFKYK